MSVFGLASATAALLYIISFVNVKALANLGAGYLSDHRRIRDHSVVKSEERIVRSVVWVC